MRRIRLSASEIWKLSDSAAFLPPSPALEAPVSRSTLQLILQQSTSLSGAHISRGESQNSLGQYFFPGSELSRSIPRPQHAPSLRPLLLLHSREFCSFPRSNPQGAAPSDHLGGEHSQQRSQPPLPESPGDAKDGSADPPASPETFASDMGSRLMEAAQNVAQKAFFAALQAHVKAAAPTADIDEVGMLLQQRFSECWERHKHLADGRSVGPVTAACLVVAANRVAGPWLGRDPEAFRMMLKSLLGGSSSGVFGWMHRMSMSLSRDKLAFVGGLMDKMQSDWGPAFQSRRERAPGRESVVATKCCYHEILTSEGAPEFVSLFCGLEREWFDTLNLESRGIRFDVPSTIAQEQEQCLFVAEREGAVE